VKTIDASGKLVMPGGIDPHTHLAMPFMGHVAVDDFTSGHRAALAGGTTWHIDFALPAPPTTAAGRAAAARAPDGGAGEAMRRGYREWRDKAAGRAVMDYSFHMAVTAWSDDVSAAMGELAAPDKGVNSFKFFMVRKEGGGGRWFLSFTPSAAPPRAAAAARRRQKQNPQRTHNQTRRQKTQNRPTRTPSW